MNLVHLTKRSIQAAKHAALAAASALRNIASIQKLKKRVRHSQPNQELIAIGLIQHIGDIVASEPVVRRIRSDYPDAFFVWCAREPYRELVESFGLVDATVPIFCLTEWILLRRFASFDHVIDLHVNDQACSVCAIPLHKAEDESGITSRNYYEFGSLTAIYSRIAGKSLADVQPRIGITEGAVARVKELNLPERFVTVHARSEQANKHWVDTRWAELAEKIILELNVAVIEIGLESVFAASNSSSGRAIDLCGRLSLLESAELIRRSELFIGIDSGPAHLANAVGKPGIVLLGGFFSRATQIPYSGAYSRREKCQIIRAQGPMSDITVDEVFAAVKGRLSRRPN